MERVFTLMIPTLLILLLCTCGVRGEKLPGDVVWGETKESFLSKHPDAETSEYSFLTGTSDARIYLDGEIFGFENDEVRLHATYNFDKDYRLEEIFIGISYDTPSVSEDDTIEKIDSYCSKLKSVKKPKVMALVERSFGEARLQKLL